MDITIKKLFLILFLIKGITTIQVVEQTTHEHDVTEQMNEWIRKIFEVDANTFKNLLGTAMQKQLDPFVHTMKENIHPMGSTLHLDQTYMNITEFKHPQLNWKFSTNKMDFFLKEFAVRIMAGIRKGKDGDIFTRFDTYLDLENVNFTLGLDELNSTVELAYDCAWLCYDEDKSVEWMDDDNLTCDTKQALEIELKNGLIVLLRQTFNNSEDFVTSLKAIFNTYHAPKTELIATHSDFFANDDQKYYYFIPEISHIFQTHLKNVSIKGIWNLESFKISNFTCTLNITDIQADVVVVDYGSMDKEKDRFNFKIDFLSLSVDRNKTRNTVTGSFNFTSVSYTHCYWERQSNLIVQRIKSAIANSIFPWVTRTTRTTRTSRQRVSNCSTSRYDITELINKCILKLFKSVEIRRVIPFLNKFKASESTRFEYITSGKTNEFQDEKIFGNIRSFTSNYHTFSSYNYYIGYKFTENKIIIDHFPAINFAGAIAVKNDSYYEFSGSVSFHDDKMIVVKLPKNPLEKTFYIDLSDTDRRLSFDISVNNNSALAALARSEVPRMVADNIEQNVNLKRAMNKIFNLWPKQHIVSKRRDFLDDEQQFYYSIPEAFFFCFRLKDIKIRGLSNFHSMKYQYWVSDTYIYNLLIKDVHGNVTLDYGTDSEQPLELIFYADYLTLSLKMRENERLPVDTRGAVVTRTKDNNPLTIIQCSEIIRSIELAIDRSIMPGIEVWSKDELENPIGQKCTEISQSTDWKEVKKSYKKWIPFNDD